MTKPMKKPLMIALMLFAGCAMAQVANAATLTIVVDGIIKTKGSVLVSVFDKEVNWLKDDIRNDKVQPVAPSTVIVFADIKPGEYAVWVHDDLNDNGDLDRGAFGKPKEPYGFSNDSGHPLGPAEWSENPHSRQIEQFSFSVVVKNKPKLKQEF